MGMVSGLGISRPGVSVRTPGSHADIEQQFAVLAYQWRVDTLYVSAGDEVVAHPAYKDIIALGHPALPLILQALLLWPGPWFEALRTLSGEDPVVDGSTFDEAVAAWLEWGKAHGHLV